MENWSNVKIETARLMLRDIRKGDDANIALHANNLRVGRFMGTMPFPYTLADGEWWVNQCIEAQAKGIERTKISLGITIKPNDLVVGGIGIDKIDRWQGTATMGYWIGEEFWRRGFVSEAMEKAIAFAFNELNLRRIDISAAVENDASNNLIRKLGFVHEGLRRQRLVPKATGIPHDENVYGLLRSEWVQNQTGQ